MKSRGGIIMAYPYMRGYSFGKLFIDEYDFMNCRLKINKVVYHNPATIIYWNDGTKTVVKCDEDDTYDKEKGFLLCCMKKLYRNKGNYNNELKKWCPEEKPIEELPHWIKGKDFIKCSKCGFDALFPVKKCPKCGSMMKLRNGKFGEFYGCSGYPDCTQVFWNSISWAGLIIRVWMS